MTAWIIPGAFLCVAFVILGIGVAQFMGSNDGAESAMQPGRPARCRRVASTGCRRSGRGTDLRAGQASRTTSGPTSSCSPRSWRSQHLPAVKWVEPPTSILPSTGTRAAGTAGRHRGQVSARLGPRRPFPNASKGPFVIVRRITDSNDPSIVTEPAPGPGRPHRRNGRAG